MLTARILSRACPRALARLALRLNPNNVYLQTQACEMMARLRDGTHAAVSKELLRAGAHKEVIVGESGAHEQRDLTRIS
jgi:hypothetical protein